MLRRTACVTGLLIVIAIFSTSNTAIARHSESPEIVFEEYQAIYSPQCLLYVGLFAYLRTPNMSTVTVINDELRLFNASTGSLLATFRGSAFNQTRSIPPGNRLPFSYEFMKRFMSNETALRYLNARPLIVSAQVSVLTREHGTIAASTELDLSRYSLLLPEQSQQAGRREARMNWKMENNKLTYEIVYNFFIFNNKYHVDLPIRIPEGALRFDFTYAKGIKKGYLKASTGEEFMRFDGQMVATNPEVILTIPPNSQVSISACIEPNCYFTKAHNDGRLEFSIIAPLDPPYVFCIFYLCPLGVQRDSKIEQYAVVKSSTGIELTQFIWRDDQPVAYPSLQFGQLGYLTGYEQIIAFHELFPPGIRRADITRTDRFAFPTIFEGFAPMVTYSFSIPRGASLVRDSPISDGVGVAIFSADVTESQGKYYVLTNEKGSTIMVNTRPHFPDVNRVEYSVQIRYSLDVKEEYLPKSYAEILSMAFWPSVDFHEMTLEYPVQFNVSLTRLVTYHAEFSFPEYIEVLLKKSEPEKGRYSLRSNMIAWDYVGEVADSFTYRIPIRNKMVLNLIYVGSVSLAITVLLGLCILAVIALSILGRNERLHLGEIRSTGELLKQLGFLSTISAPYLFFITRVYETGYYAKLVSYYLPIRYVLDLELGMMLLVAAVWLAAVVVSSRRVEKHEKTAEYIK